METIQKFSETHAIRHHECGPDGKLKLHFLSDYLQNIAARHAAALGFGMEDLAATRRIWVLSRLKIGIDRMPRLEERITVSTYPSGVDKLFAFRHYSICSGDEPCVRASSAWLVLDADRLRPLPPEKSLRTVMPENIGLPRFFTEIGKIPERAFPPLFEYEVGSADIDLNRHLNNAVYARYVADVLGKLAPGREVREFQINFLRGGRIGDKIPCGGELQGTDEFEISGGAPLNFICRGIFHR